MPLPTSPLRYVGDLSRNDAACLAELAGRHRRIIEFGVGASTQIFAQTGGVGATIVSLDRAAVWIERTRVIVDLLAPESAVRFVHFERLSVLDAFQDSAFDLIFDDGDDDLRLEFALAAWRLLAPGGLLVLHDTRRPRDIGNALTVAARFYREIGRIDVNPDDTNLTITHKTEARPMAAQPERSPERRHKTPPR
ncbi:MAG: class I SAM-dependent methyltransferase [Rhodospirillales bacterium]|nr:class I SAM-dependent methyltransferase [Rhodospirillales bacterium]